MKKMEKTEDEEQRWSPGGIECHSDNRGGVQCRRWFCSSSNSNPSSISVDLLHNCHKLPATLIVLGVKLCKNCDDRVGI